ncbi:MAG: hypothetical protein QMD77_03420 [Patescibacteria group bacterium]|nr:hypothetical protein [Patescibacteria group bacterium]
MKKFIIILFLIIPVLALAQENSAKKKAYYFYGENCPHCENVNEYFQANGIYDKYDIAKLEFSNPFNARLLVKFGEVFKSEYKGSVPAIAFGDKFIVGDQPIIDNFEKEMANAEAKELPDPEKIKGIGNRESGIKDEKNSSDSGNTQRRIILSAATLVVLGGGIYMFKRGKLN